jgi:hypothetical protein
LGEVPSQVLQQALKQLHSRMGRISKSWAWVPSIQEVWAIQIFVVPPICQESCDWGTYYLAKVGANTNYFASPNPQWLCGETSKDNQQS